MQYPRHGHAVCALSDAFMIVTGTRKDQNRSAHRAELYDIDSNKWQELPQMREGRYYHASCAFKQEWIYVFCGISILKQHHHLFSIERLNIKSYFDGQQSLWEPIITTPQVDMFGALTPRQGCAAAQVSDDGILVIGGFGNQRYFKDCLLLDTRTNHFNRDAHLPSEVFPFAVPTLADQNSGTCVTVDWKSYQVFVKQGETWSQGVPLKQQQ